MNPLSPSAAKLLAELADLGIEMQTDGDLIRYRPRQAMTPALLQRLKAAKAEILAVHLIEQARILGGDDLAERLAEAWQERISFITGDNIPLAEAEAIALKQLQRMMMEA